MHPQTDIVVLVHNQLAITQKFIKYIYEHTSNFNLIFVNNGSSDNTKQYLSSNNDWVVINHSTNIGIIEGRNSSIPYIKSEYFINLDNDQFVTDGWLDKLFNVLNLGYDVVGQEAWIMKPPGTTGEVVFLSKPYKDLSYFPYKKCINKTEKFSYVGCGGMLIKKHVVDKIGLFDSQFSPAYFEDPDFCYRLTQNNYKIGWCPECKIRHLAHQTMSTQKSFNKNNQFLKSWKVFKDKWNPYFPTFSMPI